jgi:hypothetical protein
VSFDLKVFVVESVLRFQFDPMQLQRATGGLACSGLRVGWHEDQAVQVSMPSSGTRRIRKTLP